MYVYNYNVMVLLCVNLVIFTNLKKENTQLKSSAFDNKKNL